MSYIIIFLAGAAAGILAYRNNLSKAQGIESKAKGILDALKGK
jgi:hypothetical protein